MSGNYSSSKYSSFVSVPATHTPAIQVSQGHVIYSNQSQQSTHLPQYHLMVLNQDGSQILARSQLNIKPGTDQPVNIGIATHGYNTTTEQLVSKGRAVHQSQFTEISASGHTEPQQYAHSSPKSEPDGDESLLCCETFTSPTPPSDDYTQTGASDIWPPPHTGATTLHNTAAAYTLSNALYCHTLPSNGTGSEAEETVNSRLDCGYLLKAALLGSNNSVNTSTELISEKDINCNIQHKYSGDTVKVHGNDADVGWRMSESNGYDRHRMTGSSAGAGNNTLHRLSDGSGAQGQAQPQVAAAEGMLVGRVDGGSGGVAVHDLSNRSIVAGTAGAGPHVTAGTVFRPPHTVSDTRYGVAYSTAAGSSAVGSFSSLHAGVSHGAGLAQYTPLYNQYHSSYNASIMPGASIDQQQLGTYSAVLQNIGTQAAQRSPYANSSRLVPQYLPSMTQATSPATKSYPSIATLGGSHEREELRYKREQQQQEADNYNRRNSTGVMKDDKTHHFSGFTEPSRASYSSIRESPSKRELPPSTEFYKVPTGREGSLKHRILRPSESGSSTPTDNPTHSAFKTTDEPLPKRTKLNHAEIEMDSYRVQESSSAGAGPTSHLHYPQHFMMGSIIQLGNSEYKRIEDLKTDDFIHSAEISSDLKIDSSTVLHINENETQGTAELVFLVGEHKVQVPVEATVEHPFFVFGRGWSSCQPTSSMKRYGLQCHQLSRGDKCISLTHKEVMAHAAQISKQQKQQTLIDNAAVSLYDKEIKVENVAQLHVGGGRGNKSPGQAGSPAGAHSAYRSDTGHHVDSIKAERMFGSPRASPQLSAPSTAQEQMSHASPSIRP